jgi:hypothetical protein
METEATRIAASLIMRRIGFSHFMVFSFQEDFWDPIQGTGCLGGWTGMPGAGVPIQDHASALSFVRTSKDQCGSPLDPFHGLS